MTHRSRIILVDDDITNLTVGKNALSELYDVITIPSGEKLFALLSAIYPDMILLDVNMPGMDGYEVIRRLKANTQTADIPVVFLTAKSDMDSELNGLNLGAIDYIFKPFSPQLLRRRIETHLLVRSQQQELRRYNEDLQGLVMEKTKTVEELKNAVLTVVAELVECRDDVTGLHISRTQEYLRIMLEQMLKTQLYQREAALWDLSYLLPSAQLHDVGKIMIRDSILQKPGPLTPEELTEMKNHTLYGGNIIDMIAQNTTEKTFLQYAKTFALTHHERWDGKGYPHGLQGADIPLEGRLMAIGDVYDALVSERSYKKAMSHEEASSHILRGSGTHFDPELVDVFLHVQEDFRRVVDSFAREQSPAATAAKL